MTEGPTYPTPDEVPRCLDCQEPIYSYQESRPLTAEELAKCLPRCRDCDIEHLLERSSCKECGHFIMRRDMVPDSHKAGCSQAFGPCEKCQGVTEHDPDCPNDITPGRRRKRTRSG